MKATREEQRAEALRRMGFWKFNEENIEGFKKGQLQMSERVRFLPLKEILILPNEVPDDILIQIKELESQYNILVYTVIKTETEFGLLYDLLYVSSESDDWEVDNEMMLDALAMSYCINDTIDYFSEFGSIRIAIKNGIPYRVA